MFKEIPTLRYVKDEAGGSPLGRIGQLREQTSDKLKVFTGSHGRTLIDEMQRGSSGSMPAASFADIYAGVWDLWHSGWQHEALDLFEKATLFIPEMEAYGIAALEVPALLARSLHNLCGPRKRQWRPAGRFR